MLSFKNGAWIAIAAGTLFAAACKKDPSADGMAGNKMSGDKMENKMSGGDQMAAPANSMGEAAKPDDKMAAPGGSMAGEKVAKVHCGGVNSCKGHGACKTEANACAGKNGCKGQGFVEMTEAECKAAAGKILATK